MSTPFAVKMAEMRKQSSSEQKDFLPPVHHQQQQRNIVSAASSERNQTATSFVNSLAHPAPASPRTQAFQLMNSSRISSKITKLNEESKERVNRGHLILNLPTSANPMTTGRRPPSSSSNNMNNNNNSANPFRSDSAHIWWPSSFDGLAYNEQLERLLNGTSKNKETIEKEDVMNAFESLDLIRRTLNGTPAAEILLHVGDIFREVIFRPSSVVKSNEAKLARTQRQKKTAQNETHDSTSIDNINDDETDLLVLNRDLVLALELEVADLSTRLKRAEISFANLRASTAKQVHDVSSRRISTDVSTAINSTEVAEATILRVQKESAEMATRLQQSLAQQQMIRSKLVDLGMRNLELRSILEAQKRAATARSWEDVMARTTNDGNKGPAVTAAAGNNDSAALDRSALLLMGDVVSSSQTELANLVEFRQKLSTAVYGDQHY